ncbi:MAG: DUF881 domain-containing protein [Anaerovoracaceae bacterium]|jgi:uncharacterized protein YlxW (UPF0749 family)
MKIRIKDDQKKSGIIVIGILALIIGLIIAIQITTVDSSEVGALIPIAKLAGLEKDLKNVRAEKDAVTQELMELESRMAQLEQENVSEDALLKKMSDDLEKYKLASGVVDVKGEGIIATLDDSLSGEDMVVGGYSPLVVRYELMLSFVNKLKEAGAEAISINGHRIINSTEISMAGSNVNINGNPTAPPYTIKAIGNPATLEATLTIRFGIVEDMEDQGIQVSIEKKDEIEISRYSGVIKYRYAKPVDVAGE